MTVGLFDRNAISGLTVDGKRSPKQINCSVINFISTKADTLKYLNLNVTWVFLWQNTLKWKTFQAFQESFWTVPYIRILWYLENLILPALFRRHRLYTHIGHSNSFANVSPNCFFNCRESLKWVSMVAQNLLIHLPRVKTEPCEPFQGLQLWDLTLSSSRLGQRKTSHHL